MTQRKAWVTACLSESLVAEAGVGKPPARTGTLQAATVDAINTISPSRNHMMTFPSSAPGQNVRGTVRRTPAASRALGHILSIGPSQQN